jgi:hypothetical protein
MVELPCFVPDTPSGEGCSSDETPEGKIAFFYPFSKFNLK